MFPLCHAYGTAVRASLTASCCASMMMQTSTSSWSLSHFRFRSVAHAHVPILWLTPHYVPPESCAQPRDALAARPNVPHRPPRTCGQCDHSAPRTKQSAAQFAVPCSDAPSTDLRAADSRALHCTSLLGFWTELARTSLPFSLAYLACCLSSESSRVIKAS